MSQLDGLMQELSKLPSGVLGEIDKILHEGTSDMALVPTVGPQYEAYYHPADELYMGGSAGGGKSALAIALALNEHENSLLLRRYVDDARKFAEQALEIIGSRDGYNGQDKVLRRGRRRIQWGGCSEEKDKQRYKGDPHDLIVFDEIPDFLQSQYEFIKGWNRTTRPDQRCRVVCTGNPPTSPEGLWVIQHWAAWLDPTHPNPAQSGEIRWYIRDHEGNYIEVEGPGEYDDGAGRMVRAKSRTFIRARLEDNPDLTATDDYAATLDDLPPELRDAYRDGRFDASVRDNPFQIIPTAWVKAAQARWAEQPPRGIPMCAMGVDVARVNDETVVAARHDGWYAPLQAVPGSKTPLATDVAGFVVSKRRDEAIVVIDVGEGHGGEAYGHLQSNGIDAMPHRGLGTSTARSADKAHLRFTNKRTEVYWRFREALNPDQPGGSPIALPPDPVLVSDLTSVTFEATPHGIKALSKADVVKKLRRSPDRGDAVVMAWSAGPKMISHFEEWEQAMQGRHRTPSVNMGPRRRRKWRH